MKKKRNMDKKKRLRKETKTTKGIGEYSWIDHSYDILGARMLWKPKEARILKNLKKNYRSTSVIW